MEKDSTRRLDRISMDSAESGKGLKSILLKRVNAFRAPVKISVASSGVWGRMSKGMLIFFLLSREKKN